MPAIQTASKVTAGTFTVFAVLAGLYALYNWAEYALIWQDSWAAAEAMTWSILAVVLVLPVIVIEWAQNRGA